MALPDFARDRSKIRKAGKILLRIVICYTLVSVILSSVVYTCVFKKLPDAALDLGYRYAEGETVYVSERVEIGSEKAKLVGYYYPTDTEAKGLVIIAGGFKSHADRHLREVLYFVDHGWEVLTYHCTGVAESEGDSLVGLSQARLDLLAALEFAKEKSALPVVVYGHSAGGYAAASLLDDARICAAVCIAGFDSPVELMCDTAGKYVGFLAALQAPFLRLQHWFVFGKEGFVRAVDSINATDTPIAVYYSEKDDVIPYGSSIYALRESISNPNAVCKSTEDTHFTYWLSEEAAAYARSVEQAYAALKAENGGTVSEKKREEFLTAIDYTAANELDLSFMEEVEQFFTAALQN